MARYSGNTNSKSLNARAAERAGRYPASQMAAELRRRGLFAGVTAADIKAAVATREWHHVGSFAARVDYYDLGQVFEGRRELRQAISARRAAPKPEGERHEDCSAEWLEWSGSRRYPRATKRTAVGIAVTVKGGFVTLHLPRGDQRKQIGARGFVVRLADGREL